MCIEEGREGDIPDWYFKEPYATEQGLWCVRAFLSLSTDRAFGFAVGPIPDSKIVAYADRVGLDVWNSEVFSYLIRRLDHAFLAELRSKNSAPKANR